MLPAPFRKALAATRCFGVMNVALIVSSSIAILQIGCSLENLNEGKKRNKGMKSKAK
jgi:hypothetical protein